MLARVSVRFSGHGNELGLRSIDAALFLELANAGIFWIFTVIDKAARESIRSLKRWSSTCDQKNFMTFAIGLSFGYDGIDCHVRDFIDLLLLDDGSRLRCRSRL